MSTVAITRNCAQSSTVVRQVCARAFRTSSSQFTQKNDGSVKQDQKAESADQLSAKRKKTTLEIDEEIRAAMEGRSGDGGISGAELEGGKAVAMKRGVRDNMFRYI